MIFQHALEPVLNEEKTQTRRLYKPGERARLLYGEHHIMRCPVPSRFYAEVYGTNGRLKWAQGRTYAVQPGRGVPSIARIKLQSIWLQDVRDISLADSLREGFGPHMPKSEFLTVWVRMYDPPVVERLQHWVYDPARPHRTPAFLWDRPSDRYLAWVLDFRLVWKADLS